MTTFTAIAGTETQSGKPLTESLLTRLANNCLAIQEGDPTAPRIAKEAFDDGEITVIDAAYSTGASASFTFNHGEATSQTVYIIATASGYLNSSEAAVLTISVAGSVVATSGEEGAWERQAQQWAEQLVLQQEIRRLARQGSALARADTRIYRQWCLKNDLH